MAQGILQAPPNQGPPQGAAPPAAPPGQALPPEEMPPEEDGPEADESHPAFKAGMELMYKALYENNAADEILKGLQGQGDIPDALANTAYEIATMVDERTEGQIPDELIMLLGANALEEVSDIAEGAGMPLKVEDVAFAYKNMVLRWVGEQGADTQELKKAMDAYTPEMIKTAHGAAMAADEPEGGAPPPGGMPNG